MILRCVVCLREKATGFDPSNSETEYHLMYARMADTIFNGYAVCMYHFTDPLVAGLMPAKPEPEPEPEPPTEPEPEALPVLAVEDDPDAPVEDACRRAVDAWADAMQEVVTAERTGKPMGPLTTERQREINRNLQIVEATVTHQKYLRGIPEEEMRSAIRSLALAKAKENASQETKKTVKKVIKGKIK